MKRFSAVLLILIIFLVGCAEKESVSVQGEEPSNQQKSVVYENETVGLSIHEVDGWKKKEVIEEPFNVIFENENATAIISVLSSDKTVEEIKDEVIVGAGKVSIIEENDQYVSFKTDRKESIRTDFFIEQHDSQTRMILFMTPLSEYEKNKEKFDVLKESVHFK